MIISSQIISLKIISFKIISLKIIFNYFTHKNIKPTLIILANIQLNYIYLYLTTFTSPHLI